MSDEDNKPHDGQTDGHAPAPHQPEPTPAETHAEPAPVEAAEPVAHQPEPEPIPQPTDPDPAPAGDPEPVTPADPDAAPAADPEPIAPEPEQAPAVDPEPAPPADPIPEAHAEPVAAHASTDAVAHEPVSAYEPEPVAEPAPAPVEPQQPIDPLLVGAGAAAAGAAAASASRPIWSDSGDAPFDEPAPAPRREAKSRRSRDAKEEKGGFFSELFDIIRTVVYALLIALVVRVFAFQPFTIPSASMEPNLYEGDYIVVSKWSYGYSRHSVPWSPPIFDGRVLDSMAERGDIVVFKRPNNDGRGYTDYIKRVIGVPGDRVQMIANRLYINGEQVQDVVVEATAVRGAFQGSNPVQLRETLPGGREFRIQDLGPGSPSDDTDEFTVPEGHYFVMGDNRDDSMDSRYVWEAGGVGLVPHENLVGKAQVILFSWTPGASILNPFSWFTHVRPERFFTDLE